MPTPLTDEEIREFRSRLREEAERQCVQFGVTAVSMRTLAKALGCSATTPYTYFENKEEIIAEVRAGIMNRVCEMLETIASKRLGAADWAREHTRSFIDFAFNEPNAYRLIYDLSMPDVSKYPPLAEANARSVKVRTAYVKQLIAEGYLQGDPTTLGYLYFAAVHGLIILRMTGRPASTRAKFDRTCQAVLKIITRGAQGSAVQPLDLGSEAEKVQKASKGKSMLKSASTYPKTAAPKGTRAKPSRSEKMI